MAHFLKKHLDSGCGSVGRMVASNKLLIYCHPYGKDKNEEKGAGNGTFLERKPFELGEILLKG